MITAPHPTVWGGAGGAAPVTYVHAVRSTVDSHAISAAYWSCLGLTGAGWVMRDDSAVTAQRH
jgi:hypothetical protein